MESAAGVLTPHRVSLSISYSAANASLNNCCSLLPTNRLHTEGSMPPMQVLFAAASAHPFMRFMCAVQGFYLAGVPNSSQ